MLVGCDISVIFKQQAATFLPYTNCVSICQCSKSRSGLFYCAVLCVISAHKNTEYIYSFHARTFLFAPYRLNWWFNDVGFISPTCQWMGDTGHILCSEWWPVLSVVLSWGSKIQPTIVELPPRSADASLRNKATVETGRQLLRMNALQPKSEFMRKMSFL